MGVNYFTEEQVRELEKNPYVKKVSNKSITYAEEFKELHIYYTTRPENPLKKMQSLIVIACKILRVIYAILNKGGTYDPEKLLSDFLLPRRRTG